MRTTACESTPLLTAPPAPTEWQWRGYTIAATLDGGLWIVRISPPGSRLARRVGTALTLAEAERNGRASVDHRIRQVQAALGLSPAERERTLDDLLVYRMGGL